MCFNARSSITTFFLVLCCSLYLYNRNYIYDRPLALMFFIVSLMQLAEFLMWYDLNCGQINNIGSKFAFIVLCLEPLIITFVIYHYNISKISKKYLKYIFFTYLIFFGYFIIRTILYRKQLCSLPSKKLKHLIWNYDPIIENLPQILMFIFWILYFLSGLLILSFKNTFIGVIYLGMAIFAIILSKYWTRNNINRSSWKSIWCLLVNILPFLAIFIGKYFDIKAKK